jgi:hypothetical protein
MRTDITLAYLMSSSSWCFPGPAAFVVLHKNSRNRKYNLFQGLFLVSIALAIFEEWLNNTGLIVRGST